ncbi:MAG TPA: histidine phosphatase family protein [Bryobacteraceae bacterium]|nr:histidine phosphatase family protein [Bryobacteraceae bacterium]
MKSDGPEMQVYLLRHGIAEDGRDGVSDAARGLTSEGRKKLQQVLQAAAKTDVKPSLIVTSPLKRAVQTAEIAKRILGYKHNLLQSQVLVPGSTPEQAWTEIRAHGDEPALLLVGHNPLFSDLARFLLNSPHLGIDFKKGALMRVDIERLSSQPAGVLRWYLTAKMAASQT